LDELSAEVIEMYVFPGSAEADFGWGETLSGHLMASCVSNRAYSYQKLLKSGNHSSSYKRKCRGCFFWDTVYNINLDGRSTCSFVLINLYSGKFCDRSPSDGHCCQVSINRDCVVVAHMVQPAAYRTRQWKQSL